MATIRFLDGTTREIKLLCGANLIEADLRGADLRGANLIEADLRGADLRGADLRWADLSGADLSGADLRWADLSGADLRWAIGNMREVKSMQIDEWALVYTNDILMIGCKQYPIMEWREFSEKDISEMDDKALKWWIKWKETIMSIIELSPAIAGKSKGEAQ